MQLGKVAESYTALGELYIQENEIQNAIDVFNAAVEYVIKSSKSLHIGCFCCYHFISNFYSKMCVFVGGGW